MNSVKLLSLLRTCSGSKSLNQGKLIHQKIISLGLQNNILLCKNLINLYFSCHLYDSVKLVFQSIDNPLDISLWNGLIAAYTKHFIFNEALELFQKLLLFSHLKPDNYTYPSALKACGGLGRTDYGQFIHTNLIKSGFLLDVVISSSLVGMYGKCNMFADAVRLFDEIPDRDVACWNNVISCYYQSGHYERALQLFEEMKGCGFHPDSVTITTAVSSCGRLLNVGRGKEIHKEVLRNGFAFDDFVSSALVDMYGKCGCLVTAKEIFEKIQRKSVVSWNSLISAYSSRGDARSCIELFERMNHEGVTPTLTTLSSLLMACSRSSQLHNGKFIHGYIIRNRIEADIFVCSSLIDLYFKCGSVDSAENVFKNMPKTNIVAWNVMISGYVTVGCYFQALNTFSDMKKSGLKPDAVTFTSSLSACSQLAALSEGTEIHNLIIESKLQSSEIVMGALLDMYAKCGAVNEALAIFNQLTERDLVSWTSMIMAYGSHGQGFEALKLFDSMLKANLKPDRVTLLAVMCACSHAGLVDEGCYYFEKLESQYGIKPSIEHYACLIDLLGRAGKLHQAYGIIQRTPIIREDVGLLSTLFSACRLHGNIDLGEKIARLIIKKDPNDSSNYIVLSNIYASVKKWDEVRNIRLKLKDLGLKKSPGCSWIEVDKRVQSFLVEDKSHPQTDLIYDCLENLNSHMDEDDLLICY